MGWERQGELGRLKKKKLLRRDIKSSGVLAKDRPGESDTKGGVTQDSLT